ncbi:MAG: DciA family protein [Kiloniellales bacterium]
MGKTLRPLVKPLLRKRPALEASLLLDWDEAVGPELAKLCQPLKLRRERRADKQIGALEVACLSWAALELQHRAPQVIERVNAFLGLQAIERLRIRQVARLDRHRPQRKSPERLHSHQEPQDKLSPPDLPSSGHDALDRALARLAGTVRSRGDHEDAN